MKNASTDHSVEAKSYSYYSTLSQQGSSLSALFSSYAGVVTLPFSGGGMMLSQLDTAALDTSPVGGIIQKLMRLATRSKKDNIFCRLRKATYVGEQQNEYRGNDSADNKSHNDSPFCLHSYYILNVKESYVLSLS